MCVRIELTHEDDQKQLRRKIHEYMTRAEYLKAQLQQQKEEPLGAGPHSSSGDDKLSIAAPNHSPNGVTVRNASRCLAL